MLLVGACFEEGTIDATADNFNALVNSNRRFTALLDPEGAGHFVVVSGIDKKGLVNVLDPRGLQYKLTQDNFIKLWQDSGQFGGVVFK